MLFKVFALAFLVNAVLVNSCCLPDQFQFTILTSTRHPHMGDQPIRARVVMAGDLPRGRIAVHTFSEMGYTSMMYVNLRNNSMHINSPPYGCYEMPISGDVMGHLNQSRCLPDSVRVNGSLRIRLADRLDAELFSLTNVNGTIDALMAQNCTPIVVKISSRDFDSTNIFGDYLDRPQLDVLYPPAECRNASRVGLGTSTSRKRGAAVALGFHNKPLFV